MFCEIMDYYIWNKTEKRRKLKVFFGHYSLGTKTSIPVTQTAWTCQCFYAMAVYNYLSKSHLKAKNTTIAK